MKPGRKREVRARADRIVLGTGLSRTVARAIALARVKGRDVERLAVQCGWPIDWGRIVGPDGEMPVEAI